MKQLHKSLIFTYSSLVLEPTCVIGYLLSQSNKAIKPLLKFSWKDKKLLKGRKKKFTCPQPAQMPPLNFGLLLLHLFSFENFYWFLNKKDSWGNCDKSFVVLFSGNRYAWGKWYTTKEEIHATQSIKVPCRHRIHTREGYSVQQTLDGTQWAFIRYYYCDNIIIVMKPNYKYEPG